jgi:hypothetical protein
MPDLIVGGLTLSTDDRGRVHFWGEVFNLGETTQRWVKVTIRLLGERGRSLAEQGDIVGLEWTLPAGRNPFYLRFLTPPQAGMASTSSSLARSTTTTTLQRPSHTRA